MIRYTLAGCTLLLSSAISQAETWSGEGELGFVHVSGNTSSETFNLGFKVEKKSDPWLHQLKGSAVKAESKGAVDAQSYALGWRTEYFFSERTYAFGDVRYFEDKFDSFDEIYTVAAGVGHLFIDRETMKWKLSVGVGYKDTSTEPYDSTPDAPTPTIVPSEDISSVTYLLESEYKHDLSKTTKFENYTRAEPNKYNTFAQNVSSLAVKINSSLALKLIYDIRYNTDPEPGFRNSDRITSMNVTYSF
ncbi:DUF481 domain-containing protein [Aurantivibrio plasticivorans]